MAEAAPTALSPIIKKESPMTDKTIETINPLTEQMLKSYPVMSDKEAMDVVENCQKAFLDWRLKSLDERASVIAAIADELRNSKEEFAQLMTDEMGKLLSDGREEIELCASICDYTAKHGPEMLADEEHEVPEGRGLVTYSPLGVIYGIQPWNFPCYQAIRYSISSLMVGNGVLLKHSENCTGSGLLLRDIYERAGLPKGLFGVLLITHDQSDAIIEHKLVRGVTLTGSDKAGRTVAQKAASVSKKTVLELGSNDAYMVFDDADLDLAIKTCAQGRLFNNGQTCVNAKRFIVTEKNYDAFVEGYAAAFRTSQWATRTRKTHSLARLFPAASATRSTSRSRKACPRARKLLPAARCQTAPVGFIRPPRWLTLRRVSPLMTMRFSGPLPRSSRRRMTRMQCASPMTAAMASAAASSARTSTARSRWHRPISIPA